MDSSNIGGPGFFRNLTNQMLLRRWIPMVPVKEKDKNLKIMWKKWCILKGLKK